MLALRLHGSRSIRKNCICLPSYAHVTQSTRTGCSRATALARSYATNSTNEGDGASGDNVNEAEDTAEPKGSKNKNSAGKKGTNDNKITTKVPPSPDAKSASPNKTKASSAKEQRASAQNKKKQKKKPARPSQRAPQHDTSIDVMKEALAVLKDFKENPLRYSLQEKEGQAKDDSGKQSLRSQFAPMNSGELQLDSRQRKILTGTLDVLKSALTIQAEHRAQANKPKKESAEDMSSAKSSAPKKAPAKEAREEQSKKKKRAQAETDPAIPASKKKGKAASSESPDVHDAVSQNIAAVVASTKGDSGAVVRKVTEKEKETSNESKKKADSSTPRTIETLHPESAKALHPIKADTARVPLIQYGLDRVLFNEGVYTLQDPRTRVWNFDPYLAKIMPVDQFDFDALKEYITSSKDTLLMEITRKYKKKYTGSTSSMTSTMAHFHYLLSRWRRIDTSRLSKEYNVQLDNFAAIQRAPAATFLNYKDGAYAIDADKQWDSDTILSMLGKSMEKLLTVPKDEFEKYRRSNSHQLTEEERDQDESYHYTTYGDFMMRSQLDAYDPRLPGTGVFDLKTRAVVSIRMDARNYTKGVGYEIRQRFGQWQSFEREYHDMMRSAFLKYSLQVRMGRMDGIFVAYHNTERIFGFQYIPLEEMDQSMHGTMNKELGDREFTASLKLWNRLLNEATARFPEQSLRIFVETRPSQSVPFMYFFAEPVTEEMIKEIQERKKEDVDQFREQVLGMPPIREDAEATSAGEEEAAAEPEDTVEEEAEVQEQDTEEDKEAEGVEEEHSEEVWEDMMDVVERTMDNDAQGISAIREAIEEALNQSGLLRARSSEEAQHTVESLLNLIVDVDAEHAKDDDSGAIERNDEPLSESVETEKKAAEASEERADSEPVQQTTASETLAVEPPAPKRSAFGFLSSLFGSSTTQKAETPTQASASTEPSWSGSLEPAKAADQEPEQLAKTSSEDNVQSSVDADVPEGPSPAVEDTTDAEDAEKDADVRPSAELVDLIVKMTTRVGSKTSTARDTQELSEDSAKLDLFRSILSDMMPKPGETSVIQDGDTSVPKPGDSAETLTEDKTPKAAEKPLFGMVLTIRNKVNGKHVDRPEKLEADDSWDVEYTMEEVTNPNRKQELYSAIQNRRKAAHWKDPKGDSFAAFGGALRKYTKKGRDFRSKETFRTRGQPVWIMGQPEPLDSQTVFEGAGVAMDYVMPRYERPQAPGRPIGAALSKMGIDPRRKGENRTQMLEEVRRVSQIRKSPEQGSESGSPEAAETSETGSSSPRTTNSEEGKNTEGYNSAEEEPKAGESVSPSFREWREKQKAGQNP